MRGLSGAHTDENFQPIPVLRLLSMGPRKKIQKIFDKMIEERAAEHRNIETVDNLDLVIHSESIKRC